MKRERYSASFSCRSGRYRARSVFYSAAMLKRFGRPPTSRVASTSTTTRVTSVRVDFFFAPLMVYKTQNNKFRTILTKEVDRKRFRFRGKDT